MTTTIASRFFTFGAMLALLAAPAIAPGADDDKKTQSIDGDGISFEAPAAWKAEAPQSPMRKAKLRVEPARGDKEGAELILFAFGNAAGGVDSNVERYQRMFRDKDGNPPKVDVKTVKAKNIDVNRVEIAGTYAPTAMPGQAKQEPKDNYRLLAAIVITPKAGYFLRMVGPRRPSAARDDFDRLIKTIEVDKK